MEGTLISIQDAAGQLGLTPQQVRKLCRDSKLTGQKLGNTWVLEAASVAQYMSTHSCGTLADRPAKEAEQTSGLAFHEPVALSFFTGAMGLDLGLEKAGFKTLLACEVDKACRKTILKNKPEIALIGDIRDYSATQIRAHAGLQANHDIDLIVGGPPCQAFSTAGNRKGFEDDRGNVFLTFIDRILELQPKYAVIENVRGILSAPLKHRPHAQRGKEYPALTQEELKGGALLHVLDRLRGAGYGVSFNLYNAANFGTPQKRERVIIIAARNGKKPPYLAPTHASDGCFGLPIWNTFEDAVGSLPKTGHRHLNFPDKRLKFYKMLGPGQYWKHLPEAAQKEALGKSYFAGGGKTGFFRRLAWDQPAPTLVTHPAMPATDLAHPEENRPRSIEEYKRIQQFPDHWQIEGSLVEQYRQIGNAVPVGLGKAVGKLMMDLLGGHEPKHGLMNFKYSRYRNTDEQAWEQEVRQQLQQQQLKLAL